VRRKGLADQQAVIPDELVVKYNEEFSKITVEMTESK
jgi:hypothetical protein